MSRLDGLGINSYRWMPSIPRRSGHDLYNRLVASRTTTTTSKDRWHIYISFNACANAPRFGPATRPDWVVSRNTRALPVEDDDALLKEAAGRVAA